MSPGEVRHGCAPCSTRGGSSGGLSPLFGLDLLHCESHSCSTCMSTPCASRWSTHVLHPHGSTPVLHGEAHLCSVMKHMFFLPFRVCTFSTAGSNPVMKHTCFLFSFPGLCLLYRREHTCVLAWSTPTLCGEAHLCSTAGAHPVLRNNREKNKLPSTGSDTWHTLTRPCAPPKWPLRGDTSMYPLTSCSRKQITTQPEWPHSRETSPTNTQQTTSASMGQLARFRSTC